MNATKPTFNQIYTFHFDHIYNYINGKVNKSIDSFSLAQNTFEKFYLKKDNYIYSNLKDVAKILFQIANNIIIDTYRKKRLNTSNLDELSENGMEVSQHTFEDANEVILTFYNALKDINDTNKKILVMFFIEGYSQKELSELFNININTIKSIINRNKKILQNKLSIFI